MTEATTVTAIHETIRTGFRTFLLCGGIYALCLLLDRIPAAI